MTSVLSLSMGCLCLKQSVIVNGRRFYSRGRIAEGGFSVIDLLEDARTHKNFALKRITCHSHSDENVAKQEIEIMRMLKHENLIALEESEIVPINSYSRNIDIISDVLIVMPYYYSSLQDRMDKLQCTSSTLSEKEVWAIFYGICKAVEVMHSHNPSYAHRDIKPGNVMLDNNDIPILMDLGSAAKARVDIKNVGDARALQDEAAERCSMLYRAPELFSVDLRSTIDERTDIWSLGCLLYAMAFLESPFEKVYQRGDSIALAVAGRNITFPTQHSYSRAVEELVLKQMTLNPMERPFVAQVLSTIDEERAVSSPNANVV